MTDEKKPNKPHQYRSEYMSVFGSEGTPASRVEMINRLDRLSPQAFNGLMQDVRAALDTPTVRVMEPAVAGVAGLGLGYLTQRVLDYRLAHCVPVTAAGGLLVGGGGVVMAKSPTRKAAAVAGGLMFALGSQVYAWQNPRTNGEEPGS